MLASRPHFPKLRRMDGLVEMKCKNCGSALSPEDISPQLAAARCQHCNALFALPSAARPEIGRPAVAMPKSFRFERSGDAIRLTRRWFGPMAFVMLFFAILWNGFLLVWHGIALSQGLWFMSAFGLIHTAVGLFLIYYVLALFLNSTALHLSPEILKIETGPLPWKGNKSLPAAEVEQIYCREKISRNRNGSSTTYNVEAVLRGNRRETLVTGLGDPDHARFIEQQIERHLHLADTRVAGEYAG